MKQQFETLETNQLSSIMIHNAFEAIIYYAPVKNEDNEVIDFQFVFMNDASFKILTGDRSKYIGNRFLDLFPYAKEDGMFDAFKRTYLSGEPSEDGYYYNYGEYEGWYRDSVIKYEDGIIVYFRDITTQKKLELDLKAKTVELEKALKEKELLLRETNHRIKNNLQIITSLLNLKSHQIKDPFYLNLFDISRQRIQTIATIHQKLYESSSLKSVNFKQFIIEIVDSLSSIYPNEDKEIQILYDIDELDLDLNHSVNIGLIINELLTNSLKYAFNHQEHGIVSISLKVFDKDYLLIVQDNGVGLPKGFIIDSKDSIGLMLVRSLAEQMNGNLEIENINGCKFQVKIPLDI